MGKPEIRFKGYTDEWEQRKLGDSRSCYKKKYQDFRSRENIQLTIVGSNMDLLIRIGIHN